MMAERTVVIKSADEIQVMREAGKINAMALEAVRQAIRPGVSTKELDEIAEEVIYEHKAIAAFKNYPGPYPYPATICISINEELVHGIPGPRKLQEGEIVSVDCGTISWMVSSPIRLSRRGEISSGARYLLKVTEQALYIGIEKMRSGNRVGDVSAAIQEYVEGHGYHVPREYTGHGVGRQMHEGPLVPNFGIKGRGLVLKPGITVALEPMVLVGTHRTRVLSDQWTVVAADNSLTAHFEHTVAVTDGDPMILTVSEEENHLDI
jgi:methionyl aminopeptidase